MSRFIHCLAFVFAMCVHVRALCVGEHMFCECVFCFCILFVSFFWIVFACSLCFCQLANKDIYILKLEEMNNLT